jgi:diaminopimelate epimerase
MSQRFHKMHGLGNDFVVFDARPSAPVEPGFVMTGARAKAMANRHTGIGCDQLIVIEPSDVATVRMRIFNNDGSESESCGNATRCVAMYLGGSPSIETLGGILPSIASDGGASVDMGAPRFDWDAVPLAYAMDTAALPLAWDRLAPIRPPMAVNVGNPHIVFFVPDTDAVDLGPIGQLIEHDPVFPRRVNVSAATIVSRDHIRLRVSERGTGLTLACGTGACATAVSAIRAGLVDSGVAIEQRGGTLRIDWAPGGSLVMTGPATHVFTGELDLDAFPA